MAEYCYDCTEKHLGLDGRENDFLGLVEREDMVAGVLCEGCGYIYVDSTGRKWPVEEPAAQAVKEAK